MEMGLSMAGYYPGKYIRSGRGRGVEGIDIKCLAQFFVVCVER
jgi:hypothetical protein